MNKMPFISCDWGTSNFRLRLIGCAETKEISTDQGAAKLAGATAAGSERAALFRATLRRGLEQLAGPTDLPVVISGMASSSIGWKELPYAELPFALDGRNVVREQLEDRVHLISGLRSATDIMRGEETQALGLATALGTELPARAIFVLPGTHSKHLEVADGFIVSFRTYMTGELFTILARHSVLRHSVAAEDDAALDQAAFRAGVEESQKETLTATLFRVRTRQVLDRHGPSANSSFLSGLLIGAEFAGLTNVDCPIIVAAGESLREMYQHAGEVLKLGSKLQTRPVENLAALGQEMLLQRGSS